MRALRSDDSNISRSMHSHAAVEQLVVVRHVAGARDDRARCGKCSRARSTIASDCSMSSTATTSTLARAGAGGAQQVEPRRVAVEDAEAELAQRLDRVGVVVEHGELQALRASACGRRSGRSGRSRQMITLASCCSEISSIAVAPRRAVARQQPACRAATSSSGVSSIESATAPIRSDATPAAARRPGAAWNTTKANSPPCASSSVNTGRSWQRHGPSACASA